MNRNSYIHIRILSIDTEQKQYIKTKESQWPNISIIVYKLTNRFTRINTGNLTSAVIDNSNILQVS